MKKTMMHTSTIEAFEFEALCFSHSLLSESYLIEYGHKEYIQQASGRMDYFFLLLEGKAKIIKTEENGKQAILQFLHPGDYIGELTLVEAEKEPKDISCLGKVVCLAIPMAKAKEALLSDLFFLQRISQYIGKKLLDRTNRSVNSQLLEFKYRLADTLLQVSVDDIYLEKNTEIAEYLGVSYRHLLFTFQKFREQKLISQGRPIKINRLALETFLKQR